MTSTIGMLRVREALAVNGRKEFTKEMMLRAAGEIYYVPEGTPLSTQLIQHDKESRFQVTSEYGDIRGLVTVEDILERDRWRLHHIDVADTGGRGHAIKRRFGHY